MLKIQKIQVIQKILRILKIKIEKSQASMICARCARNGLIASSIFFWNIRQIVKTELTIIAKKAINRHNIINQVIEKNLFRN